VSVPASCARFFFAANYLKEFFNLPNATTEFLIENRRMGDDRAPAFYGTLLTIVNKEITLILDSYPFPVPVYFNPLPWIP
jgi:hypothetical protein